MPVDFAAQRWRSACGKGQDAMLDVGVQPPTKAVGWNDGLGVMLLDAGLFAPTRMP